MRRWQSWSIAVLILVLWAAWLLQYPIFQHFGITWSGEKLGTWGDTFGALNALFAAAACIGVIATFRLQSLELSEQRQQLYQQKVEQEQERFESHFFQLLGLLRQLKNEITIPRHHIQGNEFRGQEALEFAGKSLETALDPYLAYSEEVSGPLLAEKYIANVHQRSEATLGPYFRIIYSILRRISENSALSAKQKISYGNLLRSQLSSAEVFLAAANGLTEASNDFRVYIIEFRLLKYLPKGGYRDILESIYPPETFKARD